jgi:hypothetical protein
VRRNLPTGRAEPTRLFIHALILRGNLPWPGTRRPSTANEEVIGCWLFQQLFLYLLPRRGATAHWRPPRARSPLIVTS